MVDFVHGVYVGAAAENHGQTRRQDCATVPWLRTKHAPINSGVGILDNFTNSSSDTAECALLGKRENATASVSALVSAMHRRPLHELRIYGTLQRAHLGRCRCVRNSSPRRHRCHLIKLRLASPILTKFRILELPSSPFMGRGAQ